MGDYYYFASKQANYLREGNYPREVISSIAHWKACSKYTEPRLFKCSKFYSLINFIDERQYSQCQSLNCHWSVLLVQRKRRWWEEWEGWGGGDYLREAINQGTVILKEMRQMTKSIRTHTCSHRLDTNIDGSMLKCWICS